MLLAGGTEPVHAYALEGVTWPPASKVVMHLGFTPSTTTLQDAFPDWNASAADAAAIWNGYLDFITFTTLSSSTVPQTSGDGINSAFFSSTAFGDGFGEDTLAVTLILSPNNGGSTEVEADVAVNTAFQFNSYRGPLQTGFYDFHRIMLHEFGHVLGLAHTNDNTTGQAIMEPVISDLDHLGPDDILGIRRTYGASLVNTGQLIAVRVGDSVGSIPLRNFQANNDPTSYSLDGLPAGVTYDAAAGTITGNPKVAGTFDPVIIAHGPNADAYGSFPLNVYSLDRVQGLEAIIPTAGYRMVGDPARPAIYTAGIDGIKMIDTDSFAVTDILPGDFSQANLSVSADDSILLYTLPMVPVQEPGPVYRISLDTMAVLPTLTIPTSQSPVLEGVADQDYVAGPSGVYQFDRTTGTLQAVVLSTGNTDGFGIGPGIALSPDRNSLYVTDDFSSQLLIYDVSGPTPALVHAQKGDVFLPADSEPGWKVPLRNDRLEWAGATLSGTIAGPHTVHFLLRQHLRQPGRGWAGWVSLCECGWVETNFSLYNPISLQQTCSIDVDRFDLAPIPNFTSPSQAVFDNSGQNIFVGIDGLPPEVWVFPTNVASLPPPAPDPTRDLLNISTRARVATGDNVLIVGFIVLGPNSKKVLIRGLGPSLPSSGAMDNPVLTLYDSAGNQIATNDDWIQNRINIIATQIPPASPRESAIVATLAPGSYTAVVQDLRSQPGIALVETYDLDASDSALANISTRGEVGTGDDVMIGGFIIGGTDSTNVLIRALGPSLSKRGITGLLSDPVLEIHDATGKLIMSNDNWRDTQEAAISATGIPPGNNSESAIIASLSPGNYTAVVRGQNNGTGVALVEVYNLDAATTAK